ncbi:putative oxidoreductase [Thozetella sp. PMI_491]|nr:putative oxidoreductase [Thozetella sp. PMI_491]
MAPIRVGLIGLLSKHVENPTHTPGCWASVAHLPTHLNSPEYEIVAVCNSSTESAQKAIVLHNLPPSTKAYGNPADIAADPNVDLVVVTVHTQKHYELARPALLKGKQVFVEWPLGASLAEAEELAGLAETAKLKTMVGTQARASPVTTKIKELISSGQIGQVRSTSVLASLGMLPMDAWFAGAESYLEMATGATEYQIQFGHFIDSFIDVLGDFSDLSAILKSEFPLVPVFDGTGKMTNPGYRKTSPEQILVQGQLESGTVASIAFRKPKASIDGISWRWIITGTDGEIELTMPDSQWQFGHPETKLTLKVGRSDTVEVDFGHVKLDWAEGKELQLQALNVSGLYDAFAKGDETRFATFQSALKTHRLLEKIVKAANYYPKE